VIVLVASELVVAVLLCAWLYWITTRIQQMLNRQKRTPRPWGRGGRAQAAGQAPHDEGDVPVSDDLTDEQRAALIRHGYDPDAPYRGVSGGPQTYDIKEWVDGKFVTVGKMRNRICYLDGIPIDRHEGSDLDPGGGCIHCGKEWSEIREIEGDDW
jgi:hypothetical protein